MNETTSACGLAIGGMRGGTGGGTGGVMGIWGRTAAWAAALIVMSLAWMGGCSMGQKATHTRTMDLNLPHQAGTGLDVRTRNGRVEVLVNGVPEGDASAGATAVDRVGAGLEAAVSEVEIHAVIAAISPERAQAAEVRAARREDGTLVVSVVWPDGRPESSEGVAITVRVPDVTGVNLETSNGSVHVTNASGLAELDTSNGSIVVNNHAGDVNASTSNGQIEINDVTGSVDASSSNGSIDLINIAGRSFAETSNGNVLVQLARTGRGPCIIETSNGNAELIVGPGFRGELACETSNGRIVADIPHAEIQKNDRTSVVLRVGEEGGRSRVSTSNGSIRVKYVGDPRVIVPTQSSRMPEVVVRSGLALGVADRCSQEASGMRAHSDHSAN